MKNNLEHQFWDALNNYELPYNPTAWSNLSQRLDQLESPADTHQNDTHPPSHSTLKWVLGSLSILTSVALIYYFVSRTNKTTVSTVQANKEQITNTNNYTSRQSNTNKAVPTPGHQTAASEHVEKTRAVNKASFPLFSGNLDFDNSMFEQNAEHSTDNKVPTNKVETFNMPPNSASNDGTVGNDFLQEWEIDELCQGDILPIKNSALRSSILIVSPSEQQTEIKANSSSNYTVNEPGIYQLLTLASDNRTIIQETSFVVKALPTVNFSIDNENPFKDGIPSILLETQAHGKSFTWDFNGGSPQQHGRTAYAHFYKKGTHEVTLTVQHNNGCRNTTTKSITIDKDYNLLAPTAFVPQSGDHRTERFIPVALLHRKTDFIMQIIDPQNGAVIFQTSSTDGWDGRDANTNQLVKENSFYIWKVLLSRPEPGEPREYKGFVTRL